MATFKIINPYDNTTVKEYALDGKDKVDQALELVRDGKSTQKKLPAFERAEILFRLAELLKNNTNELAKLITQEIGKTITDSRIEVQRAATTITCSGEEARRIEGEALHSDAYAPKREKWGITQRHPLGVVLAITPFNFPVNLAVHKIGPAFAAGNTLLFKPGLQNYLTGQYLTRLCHEAGMPENTIQMVTPDIDGMNYLTAHPQVDCISFTGGVVTARAIAKNAGYKKLLLELGGNDPLIVMDDGDVALAVNTAINQRFGGSGQRCTACKRLFIHEKVYDDFKNLLLEKSKSLKIGDPLKEDTFIGPVVSSLAADEIMARIADAVKSGAKLIMGGERDGNIIIPTVLENVVLTCTLVKDETFGPVMPLFKFSNLDDAIRIINGTDFGLQAGVFTNNLATVKKLFLELEVGALAVNDGPGFRAEHFPFGGVKHSGLGREGVKYAIQEMTYIKTLVL